MTIAGGIMGALFHRERTGEATTVDVSLLGTGMWSMGAAMALSLQHEVAVAAAAAGSARPWATRSSATTRPRTAGASRCAACRPAKYWPEACEVIGRPELADDERFADAATSWPTRADGDRARSAKCSPSAPLDEWRDRLADFSGQWTVVQDTLEAAADPQTVANGYVLRLRDRRRHAVPARDGAGPVRRGAGAAAAGAGVQRARRRDPHRSRHRLGHDRRPEGPRHRRLTTVGVQPTQGIGDAHDLRRGWRP